MRTIAIMITMICCVMLGFYLGSSETIAVAQTKNSYHAEPVEIASFSLPIAPTYHNVETIDCEVNNQSGLTVSQVNQVLKGTPIEGQGKYIIQAEEDYQVNAWILLSISCLESGWWKSKLARTKHNYFGWTAYTNQEHKAMRFESFEDCVTHVAEKLSQNYLDEDGKYFNGSSLRGIGRRYASDRQWAIKVIKVKQSLEKRIDDYDLYQFVSQGRESVALIPFYRQLTTGMGYQPFTV